MRAFPIAIFLALLFSCSSKKIVDDDASIEGGLGDGDMMDANDTNVPACATGQYEATYAPAALLTLLQRSGSMSQNNKWVFAAQAIVQALDQPVFDSMSVGLMAAPNMTVPGPMCFPLPVACAVPPFPQVDLKPAGKYKSTDATGVRHDIKNWLTNNAPDQSAGEGNPLYSAIQAALGDLQGYALMGKRILFVVTDGGVSCTSLSNRMGYTDGNGCPDWENPNNIIQIVQKANADMNAPVETFIVGVPGSDSYDPTAQNFPPYHMRAALSSIAKAGSPKFVPMGCNANIPFNQSDPDPVKSCHFDMTQNYNAAAVANAISSMRGAVLGCIFDLPTPEGGLVDPNKVNVSYTLNGGPSMDLYRRKDASNLCVMDGCWDYNANQKVELIGKACDDVRNAMNAKVTITVGCATQVH